MLTQEQMREQIRETAQAGGYGELERPLVIGWVMVTEWLDADGNRWLTRVDGDADDAGLRDWQREGYLHNALHTEWGNRGMYDEPEEGDDDIL